MNLRRFIGTAAFALALGVPGASAQTYFWTGLAGDSNWTTGFNWIPSMMPVQGSGTTINFTVPFLTYSSTVNIPYTVGTLNVDVLSGPFTLNNSGGSVLTVTNVISIATSNPVTINADLAGAAGIQLTGPAILELTGANTFTGGVDMDEGTLLVGSSTALGTGGLTMEAGTELAAAIPSVTLPNPILLNGAVQFGAGGSDNTALTLSGVISGSGSMTYFGGPTGTLTLSGANTYTGDTTLSGGTLIAANSQAFGPSGNVDLNGGTLDVASGITIANNLNVVGPGNTVSGSGTIVDSLTVDGAITLSPGDPLGTLTFTNGLKFARNGTLTLKLYDAAGMAGTGWGSFAVTSGSLNVTASMGTFTLNVTTINAAGSPAPALNFNSATGYSWMLGTSNNLVAFSPSDFTINTSGFQNATNGGLFSVSNVGNNLFLNFTPVPEPMTWALTALGIAVLTPFAISRRRRRRLVQG